MNASEVSELTRKRQDLQNELRMCEHDLVNALEQYDGSVKDAIAIGLVKPAFALPESYRRHLKLNRR